MVGDNMRRGTLGGQKKRVTIGEMINGPSTAFFMDEISDFGRAEEESYHGPHESILEFLRQWGSNVRRGKA